ncbi:hypothetical protein R5R35_010879 [Gryllus longicercus]|uniref:Uncharacterized protein n=1 Tax=Gryllus longicercus TaxID=2509291 RepID=A0AAN9V490_9ORTH
MGMLKGVRLDRVRGGRQKYRRNPDLPYQVQAFMPRPVLSLDENKMLKALTSCEPDLLRASPDTSLVDLELRVVSTLSDLYDRELVGVISWAKLNTSQYT